MKIIVLAGGEGKRMWPIQTDKCLIPFLGKPLLYHNLKQLRQHLEGVKAHLPGGRNGPTEFIIIASPESKEEITRIAQSLELNFQISVQDKPQGMADAILSAKDLIKGEILVVNAEDILDPGVFKGVLGIAADVVVPGLQVDKYFPGGYLKVTGSSVQAIVEKPGEGNEPSDLVKLVADYFRNGQALVSYLEKALTDKDDAYEVALDQMIADKIDVRFSQYNGVWIPLKYPWHILDITAYFLSNIEQQISPRAKVSDKAIIEGDVAIEDGAKVFEGAVIKGPCYIGKNCIIGNNSLVRESNLEEGCVTGFSSDITRSYIGANCWFHANYIGDCVLEGDFGAGSGAVLANLRLDNQTIRIGTDPSAGRSTLRDEPSGSDSKSSGQGKMDTGQEKLGLMAGKGVRVGANASIMPGVRIGANSLVGPGVVLKKDLAENKKIAVKEETYETSDYKTIPTSYNQFRDKLSH